MNTRRTEWKESLVSLYDNFRQFNNTQFYIIYSNFIIEFINDNNKQMVIFSNCTAQMKKQLKALNIIYIEPFYSNSNNNINNKNNDDELSGDDLEEYERFSQNYPKLIKYTFPSTTSNMSSKSNDCNNISLSSSSSSSSSKLFGNNSIMNNITSMDSIMIIKDINSIQGLIHYLISNLHFDTLTNGCDLPTLLSAKPFLQGVCHRLKPSSISQLNSDNNEYTMKIDGLLSNDSFKKLCSVFTNVINDNVYLYIIYL